jgi:hypothetical protein
VISGRTVLERVWQPRATRSSRRGSASAASEQTKPISLEAALSCRGTVLLAQPGAGKTTELNGLMARMGDFAKMFSLGDSTDMSAEIICAAAELADLGARATESPLIILDSLDESALNPSQLAASVKRIADALPDGVRLVLACRTAGWLPGVEKELKAAFDGDVSIFDLVALKLADVKKYVASTGADPGAFLEAVNQAKAIALTHHPKELEFLVDEFLAAERGAQHLPGGQRELYERSVRRLVSEPNELRQQPKHTPDVNSLLLDAGHLAVLALFSGNGWFLLSPPPSPLFDGITSADCGRLPSTIVSVVPASRSPFFDVLSTALFEGTEAGRMRFVHQTVAEFLAARYLAHLDLKPDQLSSMLRGRGGQLAPQVQAVAAWLVTLKPQSFSSLLDDDPFAFIRNNVEIVDPGYRKTLTESLLRLAGEYSLTIPYRQDFGGLSYDGIEDALRAVLSNQALAPDARYLALYIISDNELDSLSPDLVTLALSPIESTDLRYAAARASLQLVTPTPANNPLSALTDATEDEDPEDQLLAAGLWALLDAGTPPSKLLAKLRAPRDRDFFGGYRALLQGALCLCFQDPALPGEDVCQALQWAMTLSEAMRSFGELRDAILNAGLSRLSDPDVARATADLMATKANRGQELYEESESRPPATSAEERGALYSILRSAVPGGHLPWWLHDGHILCQDDLRWILTEASGSGATEAESWQAWIHSTYDAGQPDHQAAMEAIPKDSTLYTKVLAPMFAPPVPRRSIRQADRKTGPTYQELEYRLTTALKQEPGKAFTEFCYWAQFEPGKERSRHGITLDVRQMPGWKIVGEQQHQRISASAAGYLAAATENGAELLGTNNFSWPAFAATRALVLLCQEPVPFHLSADKWEFWAPTLINGPMSDPEELLKVPLQLVYNNAAQALLAAAEAQMCGKPDESQFTLSRLDDVLTARNLPWLFSLIGSPCTDVAGAAKAMQLAFRLDVTAAMGKLQQALPASTGRETAWTPLTRSLAAVSLSAAPDRAWSLLRDLLQADQGMASAILLDIAEGRQLDPAVLPEADVVGLWELMMRVFPPDEDPSVFGAHWVSPRETAGEMRNRLLPGLAERGTPQAVEQLSGLVASHPEEPGFKRLVARAKMALGKADWTPLTPPEILDVLTSDKQILRNDEDLLAATQQALNLAQHALSGATPLATLLWNHNDLCTGQCKPKTEDEISDFLQHQISSHLPGAVINREVQVARLRTSGIGQRTDLLIQALTAGDPARTLHVVIEVKGCWNAEIATALEDQLYGQYLTRWPSAAGLFLVAWFDPIHGSKPGTWRSDPARNSRKGLQEDLDARAARTTQRGCHLVLTRVLDCSFPRASPSA